MTDATGGGESGGEQGGADVFAPEQAPEAASPKGPAKIAPIPDSKFARPAKPLGDQAIDSVIEDSKAKPAPKYDEQMVEVKAGEGVTRPRDESGRFIPASGKVEAASPPEPSEEKVEEAKVAPSAPVKFAGREFASQTEAEKAFSDIEWHANQAAKSAQEWKAYAEALKAGGQAAPVAPAVTVEGQWAADGSPTFDVEMAQHVRELALEAGKPELYDKWVIEENERVLNARLDARMAEMQAPIIKQQQEQQLYAAITSTWTSLKQYTNPDGSPAFPEIGDGPVEQQIGEYWTALGLPAESMLNPASAMAAVALYRLMSGKMGAQSPQSIPPPPPVLSPTDADGVIAGASRSRVATDESQPPELRYLSNALSRSGYRVKDGNGRSVHLFDR
jgi:hypothetical protein